MAEEAETTAVGEVHTTVALKFAVGVRTAAFAQQISAVGGRTDADRASLACERAEKQTEMIMISRLYICRLLEHSIPRKYSVYPPPTPSIGEIGKTTSI